MKKATKDLISAVWFFVMGATCLAMASQNGSKALYFVAAGLSFLAGVINLLDSFKAWRSDDKSWKGDPD